MSCILSLTAAAVIAGLTITSTASVALVSALDNGEELDDIQGLETVFVDMGILVKTLKEEYDCHVNIISDNEIQVVTSNGNLVYRRDNVTEAFKLYFNEIKDVDKLIQNIKSFEVDYGRNVQNYTYAHIKENLPNNMSIFEEEIMEDDSLYLTINID